MVLYKLKYAASLGHCLATVAASPWYSPAMPWLSSMSLATRSNNGGNDPTAALATLEVCILVLT